MGVLLKQRCISEDALGLLVLNDLPVAQQERASEHLKSCLRCRRRHTEVRDFITVFRLAAKGVAVRLSRAH